MWLIITIAIGIFVTMIPTQDLFALEMNVKGNTLFLSGQVVAGDQYDFKDIITKPENANIQIIKLNSQGGRTIAAIEMGRMIRTRNLATFVDAKTDNCASACTLIFSSGVRRHYINAEFIKDGVYNKKTLKTGLGYHEAHTPLSREKNRYSGPATAADIAGFYEFGSKNAVDLVKLAPPEKLYKISSKTAIDLGLATSLVAP